MITIEYFQFAVTGPRFRFTKRHLIFHQIFSCGIQSIRGSQLPCRSKSVIPKSARLCTSALLCRNLCRLRSTVPGWWRAHATKCFITRDTRPRRYSRHRSPLLLRVGCQLSIFHSRHILRVARNSRLANISGLLHSNTDRVRLREVSEQYPLSLGSRCPAVASRAAA